MYYIFIFMTSKDSEGLILWLIFTLIYIQGGGTGGSIRDAGGAFGKMEAAHEEQYFRKLVSGFFFVPRIKKEGCLSRL